MNIKGNTTVAQMWRHFVFSSTGALLTSWALWGVTYKWLSEIIVILSLACIGPTVKPYAIARATELLL